MQAFLFWDVLKWGEGQDGWNTVLRSEEKGSQVFKRFLKLLSGYLGNNPLEYLLSSSGFLFCFVYMYGFAEEI